MTDTPTTDVGSVLEVPDLTDAEIAAVRDLLAGGPAPEWRGPATENGWPYAEPGDPLAEWPSVSQAIANKLDAVLWQFTYPQGRAVPNVDTVTGSNIFVGTPANAGVAPQPSTSGYTVIQQIQYSADWIIQKAWDAFGPASNTLVAEWQRHRHGGGSWTAWRRSGAPVAGSAAGQYTTGGVEVSFDGAMPVAPRVCATCTVNVGSAVPLFPMVHSVTPSGFIVKLFDLAGVERPAGQSFMFDWIAVMAAA